MHLLCTAHLAGEPHVGHLTCLTDSQGFCYTEIKPITVFVALGSHLFGALPWHADTRQTWHAEAEMPLSALLAPEGERQRRVSSSPET